MSKTLQEIAHQYAKNKSINGVDYKIVKADFIEGYQAANQAAQGYMDALERIQLMTYYKAVTNNNRPEQIIPRVFDVAQQALTAAPTTQNGWISVEDRLPELTPNKEYQAVMCGYYTDNGKGIFCQFIGFYAYKHKVSFGDDDYDGDFDEIEEQHGQLYLKEGWYENVEQVCGQYDYYYINKTVTHWQPLPLKPQP